MHYVYIHWKHNEPKISRIKKLTKVKTITLDFEPLRLQNNYTGYVYQLESFDAVMDLIVYCKQQVQDYFVAYEDYTEQEWLSVQNDPFFKDVQV